MNPLNAFPLTPPEADELYVELNEEVLHLQDRLARFHELPPDDRLAGPEVYHELIRVRRELLGLLELVAV